MTLQPLWQILIPALLLLVATIVWAVPRWSRRSGGGRAAILSRVLVAVTAVAIGLHPVGTVRVSVPQETTTDVLFVLDRTTSMGAQDYAGRRPRMAGATADLGKIVRELAGAQMAVIAFDDDARLAVPFTTDVTALSVFLQTVGWRPSTKASGSDIAVAGGLAEEVLRTAAADRPDHDRYLVYVGDGEQTAKSAPASFASLRDLLTGAAVLGYGSADGGPMATSVDDDTLIRVDGAIQISRPDRSALATIADQLDGSYHHRSRPGTAPSIVPPGEASTVSELRPGREYYWIVALVAAVFLVHLLAVSVTAMRAVREEVTDAPRGSAGS